MRALNAGLPAAGFKVKWFKLLLRPLCTAMKPSDDLFQLIKSMTSSEKRAFKLFARRHGGKDTNNYITIFDAVGRQDVYDEAHIRRLFRDKTFSRHFASTKYQLYHLVLRCLRESAGEGVVEREVRDLIEKARVLIRRGLFSQSGKLLDKARHEAEQYEMHPALLDILDLERQVFFESHRREIDREVDQMLERERRLQRQWSERLDYLSLYSRVLAVEKTEHLRRDQCETQELADDALLRPERLPDAFLTRRLFYRVNCAQAMISGRIAEACSQVDELLRHWETQPSMQSAYPLEFKRDLQNSLKLNIKAGHIEAVEELLARIQELPSLSIRDARNTEQNYLQIKLNLSMQRGEFERGAQLAAPIDDFLHRYRKSISPDVSMSLNYNMAVLYFFLGDLNNTLARIDKIEAHSDSVYRRDIQDFNRLFSPLVHFELGNADVVDSQLRSAYRYFHKHTRLFAFERTVIHFLRKLNAADENSRTEIYRRFLDEMQEVAGQAQSRELIGLHETLYWLESRVEGRPIAEIFRRTAQRALKQQED